MMLQFLSISHSLYKQLAALRRTGKRALSAAVKCEAILDDIKRLGCKADIVVGKRTKNGEQRIKNCVKYDLGGGFRLITIRVDSHLLAIFAGTHDEADQWIERHRYDHFAIDNVSFFCEKIGPPASPDPEEKPQQIGKDENQTNAFEEALLSGLDEKRLRVVFQGLCMAPRHRRQ